MIDGFDHWGDAQFYRKWSGKTNTPAIGATSGRYGTGGLEASTNEALITRTIPTTATAILGVALNPTIGMAQTAIFWLKENTTNQVALYSLSDGRLSVVRYNNAYLGSTASQVIFLSQWNYVEFKVTVHNTTGSAVVRVNGVEVLNLTNQDTSNTGNPWYNNVQLNGNATMSYFDDFYWCNAEGSTNNDFLGDCRVETLYPNGAGTYSQWTPSAGSNYENVDETTPDDDTTYNAADAINEKDTYALGNLATSAGTIYGIQTNLYARKDDAGSAKIKPLHYINATDYLGTEMSIGDSYYDYFDIAETNPDTASAWTVSDVNALETGAQRTA